LLEDERAAIDSASGLEGASALERAVKALARRDHSAASLKAKLERAGVPADASDQAIGTLERAGYVDDARFAHDRAAHLAAKGYGDEWIRGDLETQGVVADDAIAALAPEPERAVREAARLGGGAKALQSLARKGFSEESLEPLLHRTAGEE
jgi:SOS response regulatory protein OraA/RecX